MLYSIGEFATFCGLNVKTLRYYDEIGLLKPVKVDPFTKYRYYSDKQLDDVELIKTLKSCSVSLEEISQNERERRLTELRQKYIMDQHAIYDCGYDKGIEAGIEQGIEQEKIEIVKKMHSEKFDVETIANITGLTEEEINKIISEK